MLELKKLHLCKLNQCPNIRKHYWSRGEQHFCIDKIHFMYWEKNIKNTKNGTINHHPLHTLQLLLVFQKLLRGIGISTISANSNDSTPSITPTILQFSFSIFSNRPTMLHYLFHNYYQLAILPSTMPYTYNYHTPSVVSSTKIYGGLSREKIEATRLQQCVEIEELEFENRKAFFWKKLISKNSVINSLILLKLQDLHVPIQILNFFYLKRYFFHHFK